MDSLSNDVALRAVARAHLLRRRNRRAEPHTLAEWRLIVSLLCQSWNARADPGTPDCPPGRCRVAPPPRQRRLLPLVYRVTGDGLEAARRALAPPGRAGRRRPCRGRRCNATSRRADAMRSANPGYDASPGEAEAGARRTTRACSLRQPSHPSCGIRLYTTSYRPCPARAHRAHAYQHRSWRNHRVRLRASVPIHPAKVARPDVPAARSGLSCAALGAAGGRHGSAHAPRDACRAFTCVSLVRRHGPSTAPAPARVPQNSASSDAHCQTTPHTLPGPPDCAPGASQLLCVLRRKSNARPISLPLAHWPTSSGPCWYSMRVGGRKPRSVSVSSYDAGDRAHAPDLRDERVVPLAPEQGLADLCPVFSTAAPLRPLMWASPTLPSWSPAPLGVVPVCLRFANYAAAMYLQPVAKTQNAAAYSAT